MGLGTLPQGEPRIPHGTQTPRGGTIKDCWFGKLSGSCTLDQQALYITTDHIWALARSPTNGETWGFGLGQNI